MTFPSSSNPKFIFIPYFKVTPVAPVFFSLSEPAKSTKKNLAVIYPWSGYAMICCSICKLKMACDLEEESFISVAAVVLFMLPLSKSSSMYEASLTSYSVTPFSETLPSFSSLIEIVEFSFSLNITKATLFLCVLPKGQLFVHCKFKWKMHVHWIKQSYSSFLSH